MATLPLLEQTPAACCVPLDEPRLTDEEAEATAELFRALGDPSRVRIVNMLATSDAALCGCDLEEPLGLTQPTVSFHLKKLHDAGLLRREKRGVWAYWSLDPGVTARLSKVLSFGEPEALGPERRGREGSR